MAAVSEQNNKNEFNYFQVENEVWNTAPEDESSPHFYLQGNWKQENFHPWSRRDRGVEFVSRGIY